jgi:hypothetical protein
MKTLSTVSRSVPTSISRAETKRAWPRSTVQFGIEFSQVSMLLVAVSETASLRALTFFMSTPTRPAIITP